MGACLKKNWPMCSILLRDISVALLEKKGGSIYKIMAIRRFCDSCKDEIKDLDFRFDAKVSEIIVVSSLKDGIAQQRPELKQSDIQLDKKCYDKKFK